MTSQQGDDLEDSMSRQQRKRCQEKRRRQEFNNAIDSLQATLFQHDEDFRKEARIREARLTGRVPTLEEATAAASSSPLLGASAQDGENAFFNRVETLNHAIFLIDRLSEENMELKRSYAELSGEKPESTSENVASQEDMSACSSAGDETSRQTCILAAEPANLSQTSNQLCRSPLLSTLTAPGGSSVLAANTGVQNLSAHEQQLLWIRQQQLQLEESRRDMASHQSFSELRRRLNDSIQTSGASLSGEAQKADSKGPSSGAEKKNETGGSSSSR